MNPKRHPDDALCLQGRGSAITSPSSHPGGEPRTHNWQLDLIVDQLREARRDWRAAQQRRELGGRELPSREVLKDIVAALCGALFPMRLGPTDLREESEDFYVGHNLDAALSALFVQVRLALRHAARVANPQSPLPGAELDEQATRIVSEFGLDLPALRRLLDQDVMAAFHGDPAARSVDEVLLCYPGVAAVIHHRIAHRLYRLGAPLVPRIIAELAHSATGIDIHPGAQIGAGFFIDHGTGVVIGETCVIGERVRLYQAVTLGAKRFPRNEEGGLQKGLPRHPIVEDDVVIYAGATLLGRIVIGQGSMVGGNVWLTRSVPAGSVITQATVSAVGNSEDADL